MSTPTWRKTTQHLMPAQPEAPTPGHYTIYPGFPIGTGKIALGYSALAEQLRAYERVVIDGYSGVLWQQFRDKLNAALHQAGIQPYWVDVQAALRSKTEIDALVAPFLGGDDPLFGTRFTGTLRAFFNETKLSQLQPEGDAALTILYGTGAALAGWNAPLVYLDVPKNEIQFRARAGSVANLGSNTPLDPKAAYKRCYFVDWPVLNAHKAALLPRIDWMVDTQRPDEPAVMAGANLRAALATMSHSYFRVRPWFEPGPWGGQWIKEHMPQLAQDVPNYAWSFELIVPENGLVFESDGCLLEVSFDCLMVQEHAAVLGESVERFGDEFPIRFDFLDTFDGGNLSVQVHPKPDYIREQFGERFTQDETYYILDCEPGAQVYLGFRDEIDPEAFRAALEHSQQHGETVDIEQFVQVEPAHKHDLFLIPHGTIHCSGVNNLVLEISATPYIFTFKMYDWMRRDLENKLRPLNIARAFENLDFTRRGQQAHTALVSQPVVLAEAAGQRVVHLPTHADHFYDVYRLEFEAAIERETAGSCHILSLVEGTSVMLEAGGWRQRFSYAETFVVPAATGCYRLINEGESTAKVIVACVKPLAAWKGHWYDALRAGD